MPTLSDFTDRLWLETPDAVIAIGGDGKVLFWNRAAETIFGYTSEEATGRLLTEIIVPPDRAAEEQKVLTDALKQGVASK